jgi:uncharacterized Zn-finger protein
MFFQKFSNGINGIDFSSNIDYAKKSMTKIMNHRLEKFSALLDANVSNINKISIEHENTINESSDNNPCSSTIKVKPLIMPQSNRSKVDYSMKKHKCKMCKKGFSNSFQSNIHYRLHLKQKRIACDQCQKIFTQKSSLSIHKRIHTGEKPFSCDLCCMKFARLDYLTKHKRTHTGEKPYQCDTCPKKFAQSYSLTKHKRIHARIRPY